jgi:HK97 family phage portal protein
MKLFGWEITRRKDATVPHDGRGWHRVLESFAGAWQRGVEVSQECVLSFSAVYACATRIANDIAKMPIDLVEKTEDGIWQVVTRPSPFWPVLRKPNRWQNRIQFITCWLLSKLLHGNTYVLIERDGRGVPVALYVLDPSRVEVRVTPTGRVFYVLKKDNLAGLTDEQVAVPASEIIHDLMNPLFHPLCGVSPLFAAGLAAAQGVQIQKNSANFFANGSNPGGVLSAPGELTDEEATRWAKRWNENFSGVNRGKVAVVGNGLTYKGIESTAEDAQLIEQLKYTVEDVARAFGMPLYKIGAGAVPTSNNVEALNSQYYSDTLQTLIEAFELCLDEGLGIGEQNGTKLGTQFDLDVLLRMDQTALVNSEKEAVGAGIKAPNEARRRFNLKPAKGGDSPLLQQQYYSLEALAKRDQNEPFAKPAAPTPPAANDDDAQDEARAYAKGYVNAL